jgi:uncharacterized protein YceK
MYLRFALILLVMSVAFLLGGCGSKSSGQKTDEGQFSTSLQAEPSSKWFKDDVTDPHKPGHDVSLVTGQVQEPVQVPF